MAEKFEDKPPVANRDTADPFLEFLTSLEAMPKQIADGMLRQADGEDEKRVMNVYGEALRLQVQGLASHMREGWSRASSHEKAEVSRVIAMSGSRALFSGIGSLAGGLSSAVARIGIVKIIFEIKKLLTWLFQYIFHSMPEWFRALLVIIDEIINDLFGTGSPALASTLSRMHQDFMREQILLARIVREDRHDQRSRDDMNHEEA